MKIDIHAHTRKILYIKNKKNNNIYNRSRSYDSHLKHNALLNMHAQAGVSNDVSITVLDK